MSVEELIEALKATCYLGDKCKKILGVDWCKGFDNCHFCRKHLLDLLKTAHEREMENAHKREEMQVDALEAITREVAEKQRQIDDLAHECDGLRNRLAELNEAGITRLHRLLRETIGEAKNITGNARFYVEKAREKRKPDSERKAVIERLRKLDSTQKVIFLHDIGCAVLGYKPSLPWSNESREALRDKLIDLIGKGGSE